MTRLPPGDIARALAVALIWGMGFVVAKGATGHFPPILLQAFRFMLTAAVMAMFLRPPGRGNLSWLLAVSLVGATIQYSLTFSGVHRLTAGIAALVIQLEVPFLVLLGALLLGEKVKLRHWAGIALAFAGVAFIAGNIRFGGAWAGLAMMMGGALAWAFGQVMIRKMRGIGGRVITAWVALLATPQLFLASLLFEDGQAAAIAGAGPDVWAAVAYLGLIMTALGYYLWNSLLVRHEVGRVAPFLLLLPVFSVIGGVLFLGERLELAQLLGGVLILSGVGLMVIERQAPAPMAA